MSETFIGPNGEIAYRWNPSTPDKRPQLASKVTTAHVRNTDYMEVHTLLGTSGCSSSEPYWDWSVLGVVETNRGRLVVFPDDWVVTLNDNVIGVYSDEIFQQLLQGAL